MSRYEFLKMHGAGNDFVMIEDMDETFQPSGPVVAALCAEHTGIGADGLILLRPSGDADFSMRYFNRDGGEADMCGNGARCAARFASICGIADGEMEFSTPAGTVKAELTGKGVRIGIGDVRGLKLEVPTRSGHTVGFAICGVPHALLVVDDAEG